MRQACEVLAHAIELFRKGRPLQDFHTRLFAWALLFPVHQMGTFDFAANNFGRFRPAWPEVVFLSRRMAKEVLAPFAQETGMEEYGDDFIEASDQAKHVMEEKFDARTVSFSFPFRAPR